MTKAPLLPGFNAAQLAHVRRVYHSVKELAAPVALSATALLHHWWTAPPSQCRFAKPATATALKPETSLQRQYFRDKKGPASVGVLAEQAAAVSPADTWAHRWCTSARAPALVQILVWWWLHEFWLTEIQTGFVKGETWAFRFRPHARFTVNLTRLKISNMVCKCRKCI